jgi:hypothetical protein
MPRTARAPGKRPRAPKSAETVRDRVTALAFDMEEPLNEAIGYVRALSLIGYGMMGPEGNEDEHSIVTVAHAASDRLEALQDTWRGIFKVVRSNKGK